MRAGLFVTQNKVRVSRNSSCTTHRCTCGRRVSADTVMVSNYELLSDNITSDPGDLTIIIYADIPVGVNQGIHHYQKHSTDNDCGCRLYNLPKQVPIPVCSPFRVVVI